jgi:hypothetical protein
MAKKPATPKKPAATASKPRAPKAVQPTKVREPVGEPEQKPIEPLDPKAVHELFGLPGPYDPPPPPVRLNGFLTFWDPGVSIQSLVQKHRALFYLKDFPERFAKDTDSWRWKQLKLLAAEPGEVFADQRKKLRLGEPPATREVVTFLILHFLATGERLEIPRLRCKDVTESGRRVIVGPFHELGLDIANVSDLWKSPGIGVAEMIVPTRKK